MLAWHPHVPVGHEGASWGTSSRGNNVRRGRPASTCRPCRPHPLLLPAVARTSSCALACHSRPLGRPVPVREPPPHPGSAAHERCDRCSAPWNGHCGRRGIGAGTGPAPSCIDEWYEQGERGGISVAVVSVTDRCRRAALAVNGADVLDRIRRHLRVH